MTAEAKKCGQLTTNEITAEEISIFEERKKRWKEKNPHGRTRDFIAAQVGISTMRYRRLKVIGDAVAAGVPEAIEALEKANKEEISIYKAYKITLAALNKNIDAPARERDGTALYEFFRRAKYPDRWIDGAIAAFDNDAAELRLSDALAVTEFLESRGERLNALYKSAWEYINRRARREAAQQ